MSRSGGFCPRCGDSLDPGEGHVSPDPGAAREARLCGTCFREGLDLVSVPDEFTIRLCTGCGAVVRDGEWVDVDQDYTDVAIEAVGESLRVHREAADVAWGVEPVQRGPNELEMQISVSADVDDQRVVEDHAVTVRIARETCRRCGQIAGDSYAGTVQVRADDRTPTDEEADEAVEIARNVVDAMRETGDREAFITEITERPEGVDIRVSTNKIGAKVATRLTQELGGTYETSETLVTEDSDGRGVYRVAYAVRLPRIRPGDIVEWEGSPAIVERAASRFELSDLASGESFAIGREQLAEATVVGSADDAVDTTVVTPLDENSVQVLDPRTYEARAIPRPPGFQADEESLPVFRYDGSLFALPRRKSTDD